MPKFDFRFPSNVCGAIFELQKMFHNISYANSQRPVAVRTRDEYLPLVIERQCPSPLLVFLPLPTTR